jgi:hypothetical protein
VMAPTGLKASSQLASKVVGYLADNLESEIVPTGFVPGQRGMIRRGLEPPMAIVPRPPQSRGLRRAATRFRHHHRASSDPARLRTLAGDPLDQ